MLSHFEGPIWRRKGLFVKEKQLLTARSFLAERRREEVGQRVEKVKKKGKEEITTGDTSPEWKAAGLKPPIPPV